LQALFSQNVWTLVVDAFVVLNVLVRSLERPMGSSERVVSEERAFVLLLVSLLKIRKHLVAVPIAGVPALRQLLDVLAVLGVQSDEAHRHKVRDLVLIFQLRLVCVVIRASREMCETALETSLLGRSLGCQA
jgi:hypothetical protein